MGCEDNEDDILLGYNSGYPICVGKFKYAFIVSINKFSNCIKFIQYKSMILANSLKFRLL